MKSKISITRNMILISLLLLQSVLFIGAFTLMYRYQFMRVPLQEFIQEKGIYKVLGAQKMDLSKSIGDPRLSWYDPGVTVTYNGYVHEIQEDTVILDKGGERLPVHVAINSMEIICAKEDSSLCQCTDQCTMQHVSSSRYISIVNYYEDEDTSQSNRRNLRSTSIYIR